jgi:2,4-dienoyl-CoA reductase-like NADH-dependent reductase (Old Yellow Enzyme family)
MITDPTQAEEILTSGAADIVLLAREFLRDAYWPITAAKALGGTIPIPAQYQRAIRL